MTRRCRGQRAAKVFSVRLDEDVIAALEEEVKRRAETDTPWRRPSGPAALARTILTEWARRPLLRNSSERTKAEPEEVIQTDELERELALARAEIERLQKAVVYVQDERRDRLGLRKRKKKPGRLSSTQENRP